MKIIGAYQDVNELSEKVAILKKEEGKRSNQLVVATYEEHEEDVKHLMDVRLKIINGEIDEQTKTEEDPLEKYGISEEDAKLYEETIRLGGYILLEDD